MWSNYNSPHFCTFLAFALGLQLEEVSGLFIIIFLILNSSQNRMINAEHIVAPFQLLLVATSKLLQQASVNEILLAKDWAAQALRRLHLLHSDCFDQWHKTFDGETWLQSMQTPPTQRLFLLFGVPHLRALHSSLVSIIWGQKFLWSQWTHDTHKFSASNLALVILYKTWPCFFFVFNSFVISATYQFYTTGVMESHTGSEEEFDPAEENLCKHIEEEKKGWVCSAFEWITMADPACIDWKQQILRNVDKSWIHYR